MKKIIAGSVHALSILLVLCSIAILAFSSSEGNALSYIQQPYYIKSSVFETQISESINDIFDYIDLKTLFEKNGTLDLNHVIAQGESKGVPASYSLDYLIRYARSMGYYLNDKNEIVTDGPATVSKEEDALQNQIKVTYRAYMPDYQLKSPADGMMSLGALSQETLGYLAKYYAVRSEFFDQPTNISYYIRYAADDKYTVYTNASGKTAEDICALGSYISTDSSDIQIKTNLSQAPANVVPLLEAKNPYNDGSYSFALGIDTAFPNDDIYKKAADTYESRRINSIAGIVLLMVGILSAVLSLGTLAAFTGTEKGSRKIHLHRIDHIPAELIIGFFVLWILAADRIAPAFLESLEHVLGEISEWDFWNSSISFLLKYAVFVPLALDIIRGYKAGSLWKDSLLYHILEILRGYIRSASQAFPKVFSYILFILPNAASLFLIVVLIIHFFRAQSLNAFLCAVALLLIMASIDFYTYKIATGLSKAVDEQVKSERLKADLITNVSHDLKTPLTSIINYVDLIKREKIENPRVQEYINVLEQKSGRLKTLTEDLVEASKASSGNVNIDFQLLDYAEIVMQALGEFEDKFLIRRLEIVEHIPDHPVMIEADGRRLWRVIENLLNNCCKYAVKGSRVYVDVTEDENSCSFTIKNVSEAPLNISPEELTERFVRGDVSRTTEGSGLGLSIAKSLTSLMKGELVISIDGDLYKASVVFPKLTEEDAND